uniref:BEN domain-containing protein n=1 Tax=Clytia hemisphaerica TaxID=252671 RepID=A0A7M6DP13_9CNID
HEKNKRTCTFIRHPRVLSILLVLNRSNEQTPGPGHRGSNAVSGLNMSPTFSPQDDLLDGVLNEIPDNDHSFNGHHLNNNNNNNNPFFQSNVTEYRITKLEKQVETLTQLVALMSRNQAAEQNDNQLTEFMRQNNINDAELDAMTKNSSTYKEAIRRLMAKILQDEEWLNCSVLGQGTKRPGLPSKKLEIIYKYIGRHFGKTTKRMIHDSIRDHLKNTKRKLENGDGDGDENENQ